LAKRLRGLSRFLPDGSDFLTGDALSADKVEAFLSNALATIAANPGGTAHALVPLVPWICDVMLSSHWPCPPFMPQPVLLRIASPRLGPGTRPDLDYP
jgi:hypothetical protein